MNPNNAHKYNTKMQSRIPKTIEFSTNTKVHFHSFIQFRKHKNDRNTWKQKMGQNTFLNKLYNNKCDYLYSNVSYTN